MGSILPSSRSARVLYPIEFLYNWSFRNPGEGDCSFSQCKRGIEYRKDRYTEGENVNESAFLSRQYQTQRLKLSVTPTSGDPQGRFGQLQVESPQRLRQQVRTKAQQGDYTGAIALLTQLIQLFPTSAVDYNNRGLIYFQSGDLAMAIADYNTALQLNPHLDRVYNNRANYYAARGMLDEAIADYEMALDLNPSNIRAWINLGITLREMGQYELALDNFDFALHLGQLAGHIYAERGRTYHLLGDWNCAIADYRRALNCDRQWSNGDRLRLLVKTWMNELLHPNLSRN